MISIIFASTAIGILLKIYLLIVMWYQTMSVFLDIDLLMSMSHIHPAIDVQGLAGNVVTVR